MSLRVTAAALAALSLVVAVPPAMAKTKTPIKNIVLVHGAWADGSGWQGVYNILVKDGYKVSVVADPLTSLADDVAATERVLARQDGPVLLVGHSYGGAVITEAGNDPKVVGLVYISAFAPDDGENILGLLPKSDAPPPFEVDKQGFAFLKRDAFLAAFAPDVGPELAAFMADEQVPLSVPNAGTVAIKDPAWKNKPSWYFSTKGDQIIPPSLQHMMAARMKAKVLVDSEGSHVGFISHPDAAAALIEQAAKSVKVK
ncbi:MAG: alpha/beta hydrolase [Alphaproteobacteria bacterium]